MKNAFALVLMLAIDSVSKESSRFTCEKDKSQPNHYTVSCKLINKESHTFYTVIIGTDTKDSMGYLHGTKPYKISSPKNWKYHFYTEEESDSYGIRWEPNSNAFKLHSNDSICCFKVEIESSDSNQYKRFPVKIGKPDATFLNLITNE